MNACTTVSTWALLLAGVIVAVVGGLVVLGGLLRMARHYEKRDAR